MNITSDVKYIGVNDHAIDLFEGQYVVPNGMAYNSYAIIDQKIAVLDTVDARFKDEWLNNVKSVLAGRKPDYLIIQHMEPDHSANVVNFLDEYPDCKIVASEKAFVMMNNFFGRDFSANKIAVAEGDSLSLGKHELTFITAPMVHWPEVILTYDKTDKILFSADAFGKFGALDVEEDWACEARRYYIGIVGKYGVMVQNLLKKASALEIKTICPLHGPVLTDTISDCVKLYDTWSKYEPETSGIAIAYTSVYGNTEKAVFMLRDLLEKSGQKVSVSDLARCDMAEAVEDAFRYDRLVLATTTYNGEIFPFMREFINHLTERNYQKRTVGIIENGSWAPVAGKVIKNMLANSKEITFTDTTVKILSALNDQSTAQLKALAQELAK